MNIFFCQSDIICKNLIFCLPSNRQGGFLMSFIINTRLVYRIYRNIIEICMYIICICRLFAQNVHKCVIATMCLEYIVIQIIFLKYFKVYSK